MRQPETRPESIGPLHLIPGGAWIIVPRRASSSRQRHAGSGQQYLATRLRALQARPLGDVGLAEGVARVSFVPCSGAGARAGTEGCLVSSRVSNASVTRSAACSDIQADAGGVGTPELTSPRLHLAPGRQMFPRERTGRVCLAVTVPAVHRRARAR